jgi:hypothetical protein
MPVRWRVPLAVSLALAAPLPARAQTPPEIAAGAATRQEIVLTNQNLAVVNETRRADLPAGSVVLSWSIPATARTETWSLVNGRDAAVRFLGLTAGLPQGNPLADLVGSRVRVERPGGASVEAEVVAVSGAGPEQALFREGSDLVYGEPGARIVLEGGARAPSNSVHLKLAIDRAGARDLSARYIVSEVGWEANYALALSADEKSGRLEGWFTVDNRTGASFAPKRLRLLAGNLRTAPAPEPRPAVAYRAGAVAGEGGVVGSEALSESRMYEVSSPDTLPAGRTTFPLADGADVPVEKRYIARTSFWFGGNADSQTVPVGVIYRVGAKKLAAALPAGVVRVYTDGGTVFGGEDRIAHTPERTDFEIEVSEAFDLAVRSKQTSFTQVGPSDSDSAWEVTLSSRKKDDATVTVRHTFPGEWKVLESSVPAVSKSARVAEFTVPVPAGGEARLTYRVHVRMGR